MDDAIQFVLQNFSEMIRLWVRMQSSHAVRNRKRRERERQDLRVLVGSNLDRLSQMEGVTVEVYRKVVLPNIVEQICNSNDKIAQFYLVEGLIQVRARYTPGVYLSSLHPGGDLMVTPGVCPHS